MLQLIKLEIKKYKLKNYIKGTIIAIFCIMIFLTMSFIDNILNPGNEGLDTYNSVLKMINFLVTGTFLIYSSTLMGKILIGEYRNKTILVMFSYPVNRKKLILSKLIIVSVFTIGGIFIGNVFCILYVLSLDSFVNVIAGSFKLKYILDMFLSFLGSIIMGGILSLVPFKFGMKKKSIIPTVVTSVLIVFIMQPIIGSNPQLINTFIKLSIIALISLVFVIRTLRKEIDNINNIDVA